MHFVDDIDLVARTGRRVADAVVDLTHVIDAGMGGGVHFQHVHVPAFHDRLAMHARHLHVDGRPLRRSVRQFVIQRAGENPEIGEKYQALATDAGIPPAIRRSLKTAGVTLIIASPVPDEKERANRG